MAFVARSALVAFVALVDVACGPEARLGDTCNTSFDCGLELECTVVDVNAPDDKTFSDVLPGQTGRCTPYNSI